MLYADSSALRGLRYVVMDEVHYLADRFRGAVWEEIIIHLPPAVRLISLSATVSNAEEFGDWLDTVRGDTEVIVSEIRPVPLEQHVLVRGDLLPLFDDRAGIATAQVNQELMRIRSFKGSNFENNRRVQSMRSDVRPERRTLSKAARSGPTSAPKGGQRPVRSANAQRIERLDRPEVVKLLQRSNLLPAIFFIFSRVGLRRRGAAGASLRGAADHAGGARRDPRDRRGAHARSARRGPRRARLLRMARQPRARCRLAPRRAAAGVQGGRRGPLQAQAGEDRVRDRDARARHQHARAHGGAREAREVQRRSPRRDHLGGVHPADRPCRSPRHRRGGSRGHPVDRGRRPAAGRGTRIAAHVSRSTPASVRPTTWRST